jgi:hypothetical protein
MRARWRSATKYGFGKWNPSTMNLTALARRKAERPRQLSAATAEEDASCSTNFRKTVEENSTLPKS